MTKNARQCDVHLMNPYAVEQESDVGARAAVVGVVLAGAVGVLTWGSGTALADDAGGGLSSDFGDAAGDLSPYADGGSATFTATTPTAGSSAMDSSPPDSMSIGAATPPEAFTDPTPAPSTTAEMPGRRTPDLPDGTAAAPSPPADSLTVPAGDGSGPTSSTSGQGLWTPESASANDRPDPGPSAESPSEPVGATVTEVSGTGNPTVAPQAPLDAVRSPASDPGDAADYPGSFAIDAGAAFVATTHTTTDMPTTTSSPPPDLISAGAATSPEAFTDPTSDTPVRSTTADLTASDTPDPAGGTAATSSVQADTLPVSAGNGAGPMSSTSSTSGQGLWTPESVSANDRSDPGPSAESLLGPVGGTVTTGAPAVGAPAVNPAGRSGTAEPGINSGSLLETLSAGAVGGPAASVPGAQDGAQLMTDTSSFPGISALTDPEPTSAMGSGDPLPSTLTDTWPTLAQPALASPAFTPLSDGGGLDLAAPRSSAGGDPVLVAGRSTTETRDPAPGSSAGADLSLPWAVDPRPVEPQPYQYVPATGAVQNIKLVGSQPGARTGLVTRSPVPGRPGMDEVVVTTARNPDGTRSGLRPMNSAFDADADTQTYRIPSSTPLTQVSDTTPGLPGAPQPVADTAPATSDPGASADSGDGGPSWFGTKISTDNVKQKVQLGKPATNEGLSKASVWLGTDLSRSTGVNLTAEGSISVADQEPKANVKAGPVWQVTPPTTMPNLQVAGGVNASLDGSKGVATNLFVQGKATFSPNFSITAKQDVPLLGSSGAATTIEVETKPGAADRSADDLARIAAVPAGLINAASEASAGLVKQASLGSNGVCAACANGQLDNNLIAKENRERALAHLTAAGTAADTLINAPAQSSVAANIDNANRQLSTMFTENLPRNLQQGIVEPVQRTAGAAQQAVEQIPGAVDKAVRDVDAGVVQPVRQGLKALAGETEKVRQHVFGKPATAGGKVAPHVGD